MATFNSVAKLSLTAQLTATAERRKKISRIREVNRNYPFKSKINRVRGIDAAGSWSNIKNITSTSQLHK